MIGIVGAGGWGTALAILCAQKGLPVDLWALEPELVKEINENRTNRTYLNGVTLPKGIRASNSLPEVVSGKKYVITVSPSQWLRHMAKQMKPLLSPDAIVISASKGLEIESRKIMTAILEEELPGVNPGAIVALSGPTHAEEVARQIPTAIVVATPVLSYAEKIQDLLITPLFRVYTNPDRIGVQLGGALKNVIALAAGISDGLGFGDNSKAALLTRGLVELARLGTALGAKTPTFAGLSGIGDLFVTANSQHSRNFWAGREIGHGKTVTEITGSTKMVVEGLATTKAAYQLSQELGVEMPIVKTTYRILYEGLSPREGVSHLMERERTHEMEDVVSATYKWD